MIISHIGTYLAQKGDNKKNIKRPRTEQFKHILIELNLIWNYAVVLIFKKINIEVWFLIVHKTFYILSFVTSNKIIKFLYEKFV